LAAAGLLAVSVLAPTATATNGSSAACADAHFDYSVSAGVNPYPMLSVKVSVSGNLPDGCSQAFSMASYDTEGPTWPTSGKQSLLDFDTATIDAGNLSATLSVAKPDCFGQTDFYWGSTKYDGNEAPLPNYPGTPTPYDKISGSNGGSACAAESAPPPPSPEGSDEGIGGSNESPVSSVEGVEGTPPNNAPGGQVLGEQGGTSVTPPPTDVAPAKAANDGSWRVVVAGLAGLMALAFLLPGRLATAAARIRRER
jgi:hypothetical protein